MKLNFHENLIRIRKYRNYTQAQMSALLDISRSTYANYEAGNRSPDLVMLDKISRVLNVSIDVLFGRQVPYSMEFIQEDQTSYRAEPSLYLAEEDQTKGRARKQTGTALPYGKKKSLAIGVQEFRKIRARGSYYADKTMMIAEFLNSAADVTLITRPRRFGKTLNMSMLAEFLDCTKDSKDIFDGTAIMDTVFAEEINRHPVVFISFLAVKGDKANVFLHNLFFTLSEEYRRYQDVLQNEKLDESLRKRICEIDNTLNEYVTKPKEDYSVAIQAVQMLCYALEAYYDKQVYLFIDEYDTPFIEAHANGYYAEVHNVLAGLLGFALKGNDSLNQAMLTGIQRVAKENIFSGLNNLLVCTVMDPEYSQYFGFTEQETEELLNYYELELTPEVKAMYNGYVFDRTAMYNPWSLINYASRKRLEPYWVNTGENKIIRDAMSQCQNEFQSQYEELIEKGSVLANVQIETSFYEYQGGESLWGLLINAGMVTATEMVESDYYSLRIPNREVKKAFQGLTAHHLQVTEGSLSMMFFHLKRGEMEKFVNEYHRILLELPSYHDLKDENSYHMLMLGMCVFLSSDFEIQSNRESGKGRSDIIMKSKSAVFSNIIMEFKYTKDQNQDLGMLAQEAIRQVREKKYDTGMQGNVRYIGLAHCGKEVKVLWEQ